MAFEMMTNVTNHSAAVEALELRSLMAASATTLMTLQFGTAGSDRVNDTDVHEPSGAIYAVGYRGTDGFVRKIGQNGATLWDRSISTAGYDNVHGVKADAAGNVYVVGSVYGAIASTPHGGQIDAFVRKYSAGGVVLWTRQLGGQLDDAALDVALDSAGNIYVGGYTSATLSGSPFGGMDAFVRKYAPNAVVLWTRQYGTNGYDQVNNLAIDSKNNLHVALSLSNDTFVRKISSSAVTLWTRFYADIDFGRVAVDSQDNVYVGGLLAGSGVASDLIVRKVSSAAVTLWTRSFGSTAADYFGDITADPTGNIVVTGYTHGIVGGNVKYGASGRPDAFVRVYKPNADVKWTRQFGTSEGTSGAAVTTDNSGHLYVGGTVIGKLGGTAAAGLDDGFVRKMVI